MAPAPARIIFVLIALVTSGLGTLAVRRGVGAPAGHRGPHHHSGLWPWPSQRWRARGDSDPRDRVGLVTIGSPPFESACRGLTAGWFAYRPGIDLHGYMNGFGRVFVLLAAVLIPLPYSVASPRSSCGPCVRQRQRTAHPKASLGCPTARSPTPPPRLRWWPSPGCGRAPWPTPAAWRPSQSWPRTRSPMPCPDRPRRPHRPSRLLGTPHAAATTRSRPRQDGLPHGARVDPHHGGHHAVPQHHGPACRVPR